MFANGLALPDFLDTAAIVCGALVGATGATRKNLDWVGIFIVAFATGIGGGLVRDVLLQNGLPAILVHPDYQLFAAIGAVVGIFFAKTASRFNPVYEGLDTFMIGVWMPLGASKAQEVGLGPIPVIFVGTIAAVGGQMIRDVLIHQTSALIKSGYWYTLAAFGGAIVFVGLTSAGVALYFAQIAALATAAGMRIVSVHYQIRTPTPYDISDKALRLLRLQRN